MYSTYSFIVDSSSVTWHLPNVALLNPTQAGNRLKKEGTSMDTVLRTSCQIIGS